MATRREFIKTGSLATLAGLTLGYVGKQTVFGFEGFYEIPFESKLNSLANLTVEKFKPFINSDFTIWQEGIGKVSSLKLIEAEAVSFSSDKFRFNSKTFSLLFKSNTKVKLEQNNYKFIHPELGSMSLLLVPVTADQNLYEVIICN